MERLIYSPSPLRFRSDAVKGIFGRILTFALFLGLCGQTTQAWSQINAGRGPLNVRSAWTLEPGYLTLSTYTRFFGKVSKFAQPGQLGTNAITVWDVQGGLSLNYGISKHFEASLLPILYQDTNRGGKGYNFLDDMFLFLKIGSFGSKGNSLSYGVNLGVRFPTAKEHNVLLEPYAADKTGFGINALASYARDPLYPEDAFSMHFNLGYWNHNDVGAKLTPGSIPNDKDTVRVLNMTQELSYGAALLFPFEKFDFRFEVHGWTFLQAPPVTAYSRESVTYVSPGVSYKPYRWMTMQLNADIRVTNSADKTNYPGVSKFASLPNYANWRITLNTKITILPTSLYAISERDILMKKAESRRELFEQIIKEQRETESAEEELERIKDERRKAERELERLRRILEGEAERQKAEQGNGNSEPPR